MKKLFASMLIVLFVTPLSVISTEVDIEWSNADKYHLSSTVVTATTYFDNIPTNPIALQEISSYKDVNLSLLSKTIKTDSTLEIVAIHINDNTIPVFELSDGSYLEANRQNIHDDLVYKQETVSLDFWLRESFKVYPSPYVTGIKETSSNLSAYSKIHVTEKAETLHGIYYKVDGKGWINEEFLSSTDNRMEKVQKVLSQKYNKSDYSIYVKQLETEATAGINEDNLMYSASVAKLATLYYVEEALQEGSIQASDKLKYVEEVNKFDKAYDPSGSGSISKKADNKDYSVEDLLKAVAQESDNVATNMLGYYLAEKYENNFQTEINDLSGASWDMRARDISAKTAANVMEAIYYQNGSIISYLSSTNFDSSRISKDISAQVAHKIGDAYDYKHDVAIIYADEPFILSIFTNNASYNDISNIANDVYAILK